MIGYVTIGVSDMEKAKQFYTDLFADRGAKVVMDVGRIAFIGDMLELGPQEREMHAELADSPEVRGIDVIHTCGPLSEALHEALPKEKRGKHYPSSAEMAAEAARRLDAGDVAMVKGSLGSKMARVIDAIVDGDDVPGLTVAEQNANTDLWSFVYTIDMDGDGVAGVSSRSIPSTCRHSSRHSHIVSSCAGRSCSAPVPLLPDFAVCWVSRSRSPRPSSCFSSSCSWPSACWPGTPASAR